MGQTALLIDIWLERVWMSVHRGQLVLLELETSPEARGPGAHRLPHHLAAIKVLEVGVLGVFYGLVGWDMARHSGCPWAPQLPPQPSIAGQKFIAFLPFKIPWSFIWWEVGFMQASFACVCPRREFYKAGQQTDSHRWWEVGPWWVNEWVLCRYASSCASSIHLKLQTAPLTRNRITMRQK